LRVKKIVGSKVDSEVRFGLHGEWAMLMGACRRVVVADQLPARAIALTEAIHMPATVSAHEIVWTLADLKMIPY
jgi:hypothetical protein